MLGILLKITESYFSLEGQRVFSPSLLTLSLVVWYFYGVYLVTPVKKHSQVSVDSVLQKPSKAGLESGKGNLPNLAFLLFQLCIILPKKTVICNP